MKVVVPIVAVFAILVSGVVAAIGNMVDGRTGAVVGGLLTLALTGVGLFLLTVDLKGRLARAGVSTRAVSLAGLLAAPVGFVAAVWTRTYAGLIVGLLVGVTGVCLYAALAEGSKRGR